MKLLALLDATAWVRVILGKLYSGICCEVLLNMLWNICNVFLDLGYVSHRLAFLLFFKYCILIINDLRWKFN